jgi:hypothetical protein
MGENFIKRGDGYMSTEQAGAIIRVVFYILELDKKTDKYFTPSYICNRYNDLLKSFSHSKIIRNIIKSNKKHGGKNAIKTLEEKSRVRNWLYLHCNIKTIFWFDEQNGEFKIKPKHINNLKNILKSNKI